MARALYIPEIVDQHREIAASLWLIRDNAVGASSFRLAELARFDERLEANLDGLRIAESSGWSAASDELDQAGAGDFFVAGVLAVESDDPGRLDQVIECAYAQSAKAADAPYHPAYDPWRGIVSALAWVGRAHARSAIGRLLDTPRPRTRWLGVAASGARRSVRQPALEAALADREPLVRARAARTTGEFGRADLRAQVNALLTDRDEDCRFWAIWSAARLGMTEGLRALPEFACSPGPRCDRALDLLLRSLPTEDANAFLRPLARYPEHRRTVIRAVGVIGDALYVPWLVEQARDSTVARLVGCSIETIAGIDLAAHGLDQPAPSEPLLGPNDDPNDENVMLNTDDDLVLPDQQKVAQWWLDNKKQFSAGTAYFLGTPKQSVNWIDVLRHATQRQRRAAALELSLRMPEQAIFEVRAPASLQQDLLMRAVNAP